MKSIDHQYAELVKKILKDGVKVTGRNNLTYTQLFGQDVCVDLRDEFPALSLRKLPVQNLYLEFMWDVCGKSDIASLGAAKHFWNFLSIDGWLPNSYGSMWRAWPINVPPTPEDIRHHSFRTQTFDQLKWAHTELKTNPTNRQIVINTSNPAFDTTVVKCPPCHPAMVFSSDGTHLDLLILGRSQDMATGLPLDVFRYALLLKKMAEDVGLVARFLKISIANVHIYDSNLASILSIVNREPRRGVDMVINKNKQLWDLDPYEDFCIVGYNPHKSERMVVAK